MFESTEREDPLLLKLTAETGLWYWLGINILFEKLAPETGR